MNDNSLDAQALTTHTDTDMTQFVTVRINEQLFGVPIDRVHDVFMPDQLTQVPMSSTAIAGVLNLRGRIVTAVDMRCILDLPSPENDVVRMAVGVEYKQESYGLIIDAVGEVLLLENGDREPTPMNTDQRWAAYANGVHRLDGELMVILNVDAILQSLSAQAAA